MEIKTTQEIIDENAIVIKKQIVSINRNDVKWVRVDDVENWLDKKSPELLHDFIIELSKGEEDAENN